MADWNEEFSLQVFIGNKIYAVNGTAVEGMSREGLERVIRGAPKEKMTLGLIREPGSAGGLADSPLMVTVALEREKIMSPSAPFVQHALERERARLATDIAGIGGPGKKIFGSAYEAQVCVSVRVRVFMCMFAFARASFLCVGAAH